MSGINVLCAALGLSNVGERCFTRPYATGAVVSVILFCMSRKGERLNKPTGGND